MSTRQFSMAAGLFCHESPIHPGFGRQALMAISFMALVLILAGCQPMKEKTGSVPKSKSQAHQVSAGPHAVDELKYGCGPLLQPGKTCYVSVHGDDKADGLSWGTSWKSVRRGCKALQAGDTLLIGEGEYNEKQMQINVNDGSSGFMENSGFPGRPVRIMAAENQRVIIRGAKKLVLNKKTEGTQFTYEIECKEKNIPSNSEAGTWEAGTQIQLQNAGSIEKTEELPGTYYYDTEKHKFYVHFSDSGFFPGRSVYIQKDRVGLRVHGSYVHVKGIWFMNYGSAILMRPNYEDKANRNEGNNKAEHITIENCGFFANSMVGIHAYGVQWCLFKNNIGEKNGARGTIMTQTEKFKDNLIKGNLIGPSDETKRLAGANNVNYAISQYGGVGARNHIIENILDDKLSFRWKPYCKGSIMKGNVLTGSLFLSGPTTNITDEKDRIILRNNTIIGNIYWPGEAFDKTNCFLNKVDTDKMFVNNYFAFRNNKLIAAARFADPAYCDYRLQADSPLKGKAAGGGDIGAYRYPRGRVLFVGVNSNAISSGLSIKTAWKSIGEAADSLRPGDTLYIMPGKYDENLSISANGTKDAPILIRAHSKGKVLLKGVEIKGAYIIIEGITVSGGNNNAFDIQSPEVALKRCTACNASESGISAQNAKGLSIRNCTITGNKAGITLKASENVSIRDSIIAFNREELKISEDSNQGYHASHNVYYGENIDKNKIAGEFGSVTANPLFVNPKNNDYRIAWNSPAASVDAFCSPAGSETVSERPLEIADISANYININSAVIKWKTPVDDTTGYVEYWLKGKTKIQRSDDLEQGTKHTAGLSGLEKDSVYEFRICAAGRRGGQAVSETKEFRTTKEIPVTATYYLSPDGNDDADGKNPQTPWKTIRKACEAANPGDVIMIGPGKYTDAIKPLKTGLPGKPIVFKKNGKGQAILDGNGVLFPLVYLDRKNHIVIDGLTFDNPEAWGRNGVIKLYQCKDVKILNCRAGDKQAVSWRSGGFFHAKTSQDLILEGNVCWGTDYPIGLGECENVLIKNNTIVDATMVGSSIWGGNNITIVNNIWYRPCTPNKANAAIDLTKTSKTNLVCDHNLFFSQYPSHKVGRIRNNMMETIVLGENLEQWQKLSHYDQHSIQADPLFMDYEKGDFHLKSGSPAIGKGKDGETIGALGVGRMDQSK